MSLIAKYPAKHYADFTIADQIAERRYSQGCIHARQGRTDLYGTCEHYDAGFDAAQDEMHEADLKAVVFIAA